MIKKEVISCIFVLVLFILVGLVNADPAFVPGAPGTTTYLNEDQFPIFSYNFSANVTNNTATLSLPWIYNLENISSNLYPNQAPSFFSWISINSSSGIMNISSTNDTQTGKFNITMKVIDSLLGGVQGTFYFIINATNDAPNFTSIENEYNLTQDLPFLNYTNASDEERQYPLLFNISFVNGCSIGSGRNNCSLFNLVSSSNTSAMMNFTPSLNDVGIYYANISVMDAANISTCNSSYCDSNYFINKTTYYSQLVKFNVFSSFQVNTSDCDNKIFQQGSSGTCNVTINSKGQNDTLNISSYAFLRNSNNDVNNRSWFYANNSLNATNFTKTIVINVTTNMTEIGNWTINFSVNDLTHGLTVISQIPIIVNRTVNNLPDLVSISNKNTSINLPTIINITAYDDDFLIPDKTSFGGYNETLIFNVSIFNQSNLAQELSIGDFSPVTLDMPVLGTNRTFAKITFTPNSSESGNYTINLTVTDLSGSKDSILFNLTIISNNAPKWGTLNLNQVYYEGNNTYLNLSSNVSDTDLDSITFSKGLSFSSFSLNSTTGIINFTSVDEDVGEHLVTITATDTLGLYNSTIFSFTVYNVYEAPYFEPITQTDFINGTWNSANNLTGYEGNYTQLKIWLEDDDLKIIQKSVYNESLTLNWTIAGHNPNLFSFTKDTSYPATPGSENLSKFDTSFTPTKDDVGDYNITLNVSDNSGRSALFSFNLSIVAFSDNPVLTPLVNQTTAVFRNLVYQINASDDEDGYSNASQGNSNFTFNYTFLSGNDFINLNQSIFNRTTGLLNYTFNSSQGGSYRLNITVNDSTNLKNSADFFINVYDSPLVYYPLNSSAFSFIENSSQNIIFQLNHSMRNNLTYLITFQNWNSSETTIYSSNYLGNGSNLSISFTPNFDNETNGLKNITLIAYPADTNLLNRNLLNVTQYWNFTVNHSNAPLINYTIPDYSSSSPKVIYLDDYFSDIDASDVLHNQTIGFSYNSLTGGCPISTSIINWTNGTRPSVSFSSTVNSNCNFSITANEYNESNPNQVLNTITSNSFNIQLNMDVQVVTRTVTESSTNTKSISLKIVTPGLVSVYPYQTITLPVTIENNGQYILNSITINPSVLKNGASNDLVEVMLDKTTVPTLKIGEKQYVNATLFIKTNSTGDYDVVLNVTSGSPKYSTLGHIYFSIGRANDSEVKKYLLFSEEFLTQNKECVELTEYIKTAYNYFNKGNFGDARLKAEEAVNSCKNKLLAGKKTQNIIPSRGSLVVYFAGSILLAFVFGIGYYFIKRHKLKRGDAIKIYND